VLTPRDVNQDPTSGPSASRKCRAAAVVEGGVLEDQARNNRGRHDRCRFSSFLAELVAVIQALAFGVGFPLQQLGPKRNRGMAETANAQTHRSTEQSKRGASGCCWLRLEDQNELKVPEDGQGHAVRKRNPGRRIDQGRAKATKAAR